MSGIHLSSHRAGGVNESRDHSQPTWAQHQQGRAVIRRAAG